MNLLLIIVSSIVGTTVMTIFSYVVSKSFNKLYKEPILLKYVLERMQVSISDNFTLVLGWFLHYIIGILFVVIYHFIWINGWMEISFLHSFILGLASGLVGIVAWRIMFAVSNSESKVDMNGYFFQLVIAHILFALTVMMIYQYYH